MPITYKCSRHQSNKGYYDHLDGKWYCWQCKKEDQFYYPVGEVIETCTLKNYLVRILSTGEHNIRLEAWDTTKTPKLKVIDENHGYLSTALREYNSIVLRFSEGNHKKKECINNLWNHPNVNNVHFIRNEDVNNDVVTYMTDTTPIIANAHMELPTNFAEYLDRNRTHNGDTTRSAIIVLNKTFNSETEIRQFKYSIFVNCHLPALINLTDIMVEQRLLVFDCEPFANSKFDENTLHFINEWEEVDFTDEELIEGYISTIYPTLFRNMDFSIENCYLTIR